MKKKSTLQLVKRCLVNRTIAIAFIILTGAKFTYGQVLYGVTSGNELVSFNAAAPETITFLVPITGIAMGQTISGLDFRPMTGELYAFGYNSMATTYQLYIINSTTGMATSLNTPTIINLGMGPIAFDFNPVADRIRLVSASGENFRLHPVTGAIAATDKNLSYKTGDAYAGRTPNVVAVAYTNSYIGTATTSLFDYDKTLNVLSLQSPPNDGILSTIGVSGLSTSPAEAKVDMDILFDNATSTNKAYLSVAISSAEASDNLYSVNVTTGAATLIGPIGGVNSVTNIAAFIDRTTPMMMGQEAYALSGNNLLMFDTKNPSYIRSAISISGLMGKQVIVGMDFRPANNMLYALGYDTANGEAQLYTINTMTGMATAVNATPITLELAKGNVGFDFNPVADKIRVVANNDMNYRLDPLTGAIAGTDMNVNYAANDVNTGKNPNVGTLAYTNSFNNTMSTTLYNYDEILNVLTTQVPPNSGTLNTVGTSGVTVNTSDASADLDIYYDGVNMLNMAYLVANVGNDANDRLYSVDLANGLATEIGKVGFGVPVNDIAIQTTSTITDVLYSDAGEESKNVTVYPSPLTENSFIEIRGGLNGTVKVYNISGKYLETLYSNGLKKEEILINWNTANLSKGIYFINYSDNIGENHVIKVIK